jgi:RimJ/RimL family protein N-acetyltransferase
MSPRFALEVGGANASTMEVSMSMHVLPGGMVVRVRGVRSYDEVALRAAFRELSAETRYQRLLAHVHDLSDDLWRYLCDVDGRDHVALVAFRADDGRLVGVVRFVRHALDPTVAEMAVTVTDSCQKQGLGTLLLGLLVDAARERSIRAFVAHALPSNVAVRRLMGRFGTLDARRFGGEEVLWLQLRVVNAEARTCMPDRTAKNSLRRA